MLPDQRGALPGKKPGQQPGPEESSTAAEVPQGVEWEESNLTEAEPPVGQQQLALILYFLLLLPSLQPAFPFLRLACWREAWLEGTSEGPLKS